MKRRAGPITVIGSINMDLVIRVRSFAQRGETVSGSDLETIPGGKGANQAVAAARAGAQVYFVGAVGDDGYGRELKRGLESEGINVRRVRREKGSPSGVALITVDAGGENQIVVSPGANAKVTPERVVEAAPLIRRSALVLVQREIPGAAVEKAISMATRAGVVAVLNPAPAAALPRRLLRQVGLLIVNETEAATLLGTDSLGEGLGRPREVLTALTSRIGDKAVILTLGSRGAWISHQDLDAPVKVPADKIKAVDTTAAGDTFVGAFSTRFIETGDATAAARFATAAAALAVSRFGAKPSIPSRREIERFVSSRNRGQI